MKKPAPLESALLAPVQRLFSVDDFAHHVEAPLGRRNIDLLCVPKNRRDEWVAIELKVRNWMQAVWQANVNFQIAEQSYIAIWHEFVHLPARNIDKLLHYGIGLIEVYEDRAVIALKSKDMRRRTARLAQRSRSIVCSQPSMEGVYGI